MPPPFVDTNVLIRLLTGDDPQKQGRAARLFERVAKGELDLNAPDTVIADAVFVLSSPRLYHLARTKTRDLLTALLRLPHFKVPHRRMLIRALDLYAQGSLDFGDLILIAAIEQAKGRVLYSFDGDFDHFAQIERLEP